MRVAQQVQGFWERNRDICFWGDGETVGSSCTGEQQAPQEWELECVARVWSTRCSFAFSALGCKHVSQKVLDRGGSNALGMEIPATCKQHCCLPRPGAMPGDRGWLQIPLEKLTKLTPGLINCELFYACPCQPRNFPIYILLYYPATMKCGGFTSCFPQSDQSWNKISRRKGDKGVRICDKG